MTDATTNCPRDGVTDLIAGELESIPFRKCPACHGVSLQSASLNDLLEKMLENLKASPGRYRLIPKVPDRGAGVRCPDCGKEMQNGPYKDSNIVVDTCEACGSVWLDTFELGAICVHYAKTEQGIDLCPPGPGGEPLEGHAVWWLGRHFIPLEIGGLGL